VALERVLAEDSAKKKKKGKRRKKEGKMSRDRLSFFQWHAVASAPALHTLCPRTASCHHCIHWSTRRRRRRRNAQTLFGVQLVNTIVAGFQRRDRIVCLEGSMPVKTEL
jgi:hypothetical protein